MKPVALLLDIDNTVYAYAPCHAAGMDAAFGCWRQGDRKAFEDSYARARSSVKSRLANRAAAHSRFLYFKEMVEQQAGFTDGGRVGQLEEAYWNGYASRLKTDTGCFELLSHAAEAGVRLAWVSNFTTERQIWKLRRLGLDSLRAVLVTSEEAGADKPDPATLDLAVERLGVTHADAWMIGDEPADIEAARARKVSFLLLRRGADQASTNWLEIAEVLKHARN